MQTGLGIFPPPTVTWGHFLVASAALLPAWWMPDRGGRIRRIRSGALTIVATALTGILGCTLLFMMGIAKAPVSDCGMLVVRGIVLPGLGRCRAT